MDFNKYDCLLNRISQRWGISKVLLGIHCDLYYFWVEVVCWVHLYKPYFEAQYIQGQEWKAQSAFYSIRGWYTNLQKAITSLEEDKWRRGVFYVEVNISQNTDQFILQCQKHNHIHNDEDYNNDSVTINELIVGYPYKNQLAQRSQRSLLAFSYGLQGTQTYMVYHTTKNANLLNYFEFFGNGSEAFYELIGKDSIKFVESRSLKLVQALNSNFRQQKRSSIQMMNSPQPPDININN